MQPPRSVSRRSGRHHWVNARAHLAGVWRHGDFRFRWFVVESRDAVYAVVRCHAARMGAGKIFIYIYIYINR